MEQGSSLRDRLIDAGVDLVMTDGAASLGLREIARRAGVSHGAPRRYFPTHHALLSAIARRGFADLTARFVAAADGEAAPRGQLRALARVYVGYALECRGMFELMFRHDVLDSEQHSADPPRLRESTLPLFEHVVALVTRHRSDDPGLRGEAGPPPEVAAAALWANLHGLAQLWAWGSLPLALGAPPPGDAPGGDRLDALVAAALDAHLGPVGS
ncbi:TetR/AcrR family transcriptional regulator [Nonomuraea sp. NEAU-A123]|uniref:TetR/AcrR family transcriptional regulator n=1 Tax=Nonomuraea sp. NEAU-A123 TaxID=2839649 RepID=UPI001BE47193|nr:TetR/AcrR family transcriptional regulator [Nonomuraea sp. NEAU-A123]MBT2225299.1 TetR/AcrR family transcriptional regulator [Nonomuraea sp. NEAU-A123]